MNTYEVEFSEKELKMIKEATDLGLGILSFDIEQIKPVFNNDNKIVSLLKKIKTEVFGDKTKEEIEADFNKETRIRYYSLKSLKQKLEELK